MNFNTDPTLTNILNQTKAIKKTLESCIQNSNNRVFDINKMSSEIDTLIDTEITVTSQTLLRQYKSSLYQMKSEIESQTQDLQIYLTKVNGIISLVERAIKLSTGDIF